MTCFNRQIEIKEKKDISNTEYNLCAKTSSETIMACFENNNHGRKLCLEVKMGFHKSVVSGQRILKTEDSILQM